MVISQLPPTRGGDRWFLSTAAALALAAAAVPAPVWAGPVEVGFDDEPVGEEPGSLFVIDGEFAVVEAEGGDGRAVEIAAAPLVESGAIFGDSIKGAGSVQAEVVAEKKRRSAPRFGVGIHGLSGFRLRVVPAAKQIELVKNEEVVAAAPFDWKAGEWLALRLDVTETADGRWRGEGRAWPVGGERPEVPLVYAELEGKAGTGKASIWGTPYAGLPIRFDNLKAEATGGDGDGDGDGGDAGDE